jgi:hypothetical protein
MLRVPRTTHLLSSLPGVAALLLLLSLCASAHAQVTDGSDLFTLQYLEQRGPVMVLGAGPPGAGPLQQASVAWCGETLRFWELHRTLPPAPARSPSGAATVVADLASSPNAPLTGVALLRAGDFADCWSVEDGLHVWGLTPASLSLVRDNSPLPSDAKPSPDTAEERFALQEALLRASRTPHRLLRDASSFNVSPQDLASNPVRFRGTVLRFFGSLRRIKQVDAPVELQKRGQAHAYEVWALVRSEGVPHQICLLSPTLPPGLRVTDNAPDGSQVSLTGYFFKMYRYPGSGGIVGRPERSVPLLVGQAVPILDNGARAAVGATSVLGSGFSGGLVPACPPTFLQAGEQADLWVVEDLTRPAPLERRYLDRVRDRQPLPAEFIVSDAGREEAFAYIDAVSKASRRKSSAFAKNVDGGVTYAHVMNQPQVYRGKVVRIEGTVRRVRKLEPMLMLRQAGVKELYEVWMLRDKIGEPNPAVLLCTSLPPGVTPSEDVQPELRGSFVGYFFKVYRYKSPDTLKPKEFRICPMMIGYLVPRPAEAAGRAKSSYQDMVLPGILLVLLASIVFVLVMTYVFRRADSRVRSRIGAVTTSYAHLPEPADPGEGEVPIQETTEQRPPLPRPGSASERN